MPHSPSQPPTHGGPTDATGPLRRIANALRKRRTPAALPSPATLTSQARVPTARADRYAKQLCSHAASQTPHAQWTPPHGVIEFPDGMGTCRLTAQPDCLVLVLHAANPTDLTRLQQIVGGNIQRFAARDNLTVQWHPG